ncbi:glycosyltransferase family 61 protein [Nocardioides sp. GY 10113]|uniref:glycosyltransferase family 61 protein n=1 Tax=Nocardioides sp. GY 10113 TaxID=2569761 RepID=UPI0010A8FA3B|nr:glycosyltransferase family 61 protein [Nocardioides sp. GY 10113]TIC89220.1 glycosyltransferase family 61 protein [Nocardioides sp. GY 10113]
MSTWTRTTVGRRLGRLLRGEAPSPPTTQAKPAAPRDGVADVVADHLDGRTEAVVVLLGSNRPQLLQRLRTLGPGWTVLEVDDTDERACHLELTLAGPVDVVVDRAQPAGRLVRFRDVFFHVRAGGVYVVPGGGTELGPEPGGLGRHLASAAALEAEPLRAPREGTRRVPENIALAIRMHVQARTVGRHLVLSHDLPDVLSKLDEDEADAYLERLGGPHRVLLEIPAETPPDARVITEGPGTRARDMAAPITQAAIRLRDYRDVVVDVEQLVLTDRVVLPDSYRHNQYARLVNRGIIDVSPRLGVPVRPVPDDLPLLEGTYLHLDNEIRGHFGHTLTEVLSRMWSWSAALEIDPDVKVLMTAARVRPELAEWELDFYETCGIPRDRILKLDGAARVERLLSGSPMFSNPQFVHPRILETWDRVGDTLAARASDREWPSRIFIGRRLAKRACLNAEEVEAVFAEYGFEVVYPEDLPLGDQVAMFRAADVVAGYAGSGMFHIAFVPHPLRVIQISSDGYTPRNEVLMSALRGHRIDAVVSAAQAAGVQADFAVDLEREGPYLRSVLEAL